MAYVGIQTLLITYKMRAADKEFEQIQIAQKLTDATKLTEKTSAEFVKKKSDLKEKYVGQDQAQYQIERQELEDTYEDLLDELSKDEAKLTKQKNDCETELATLNGYVKSWQSALVTNIKNAHTYGPNGQ